eukprot:TRINITY_DN32591_c0_g1_i1.p1 TRINITY_DN32591_c0_g1~~TRINITY_DN32591_c0_g1_i1.p1  ORF type:complete len:421 (-),score=56.56 TRINITY_DN32591_c0_g1_i1:488-1750(-)
MRSRDAPLWRLLLPFLLPASLLCIWTASSRYRLRGISNLSEVDVQEAAAQAAFDDAAAQNDKSKSRASPAGGTASPSSAALSASFARHGDPLPYPDLRCLPETFRRPDPVVKSLSSDKWIEVTFLNMPERIRRHKTPPRCLDKDQWRGDKIGRPIRAPTIVMLRRAKEVGHPCSGLLDMNTQLPPRPCTTPVPRILHFVWLCSPLPNRIALRLVNFAVMNPTWKIMLLVDVPLNKTEEEVFSKPEVTSRPSGGIVVHFMHSYGKEFRNLDVIRKIRNFSLNPRHLHVCAGMSDVARLEVMYKFGGIYMDTDFMPNRPFDDYGDLFRWPFVSHKVCGINIINSIIGMDRRSGFLNFALDAYRENCLRFKNCMPEGGAGPPFIATAILRYNSSDIMLIGQQFFHDSKKQIVSHLTENTWGQR